MGIGADEGLAGLAEPLQMELVADAVARTGEPHAVFGSDALQVLVVIGIHKAALQCIVVNVCNGKLGFDLGNAHGFKFQVGHGSRGILGQRLVDFQGNFLPGHHLPGNQMALDDFFSDCIPHFD